MDYEALQLDALELLSEFGAPMQVFFVENGDYDPDTGATKVEKKAILKGVVLPIDSSDINGTSIQAGDVRVLLSVHGATRPPKTGDYVLIGNERFSIVDHKHIAPAGVHVLFDVQARK